MKDKTVGTLVGIFIAGLLGYCAFTFMFDMYNQYKFNSYLKENNCELIFDPGKPSAVVTESTSWTPHTVRGYVCTPIKGPRFGISEK